MRTSQSVLIGGWIFISIFLLTSLGSIWVFTRMTPAIDEIIRPNELSLSACEKMLSYLVLSQSSYNDELERTFVQAWERAEANISEKGEKEELEIIKSNYAQAFRGNGKALESTLEAIMNLSAINKNAMDKADKKARQIGRAGAWGVVFMSSAAFVAALIFLRILRKNLINPIEEIHSVLTSLNKGDKMRRCSCGEKSPEINFLYGQINELIDYRYLSQSKNEL